MREKKKKNHHERLSASRDLNPERMRETANTALIPLCLLGLYVCGCLPLPLSNGLRGAQILCPLVEGSRAP
jgi:hypothetical protein